ncbi:MAG: type II toxin-antitoxin system VapB family antitoxin [Actinobacteria bacterium]|nr:type II toxin-antitoxin system VapB family antitoxin [Actinomycetota bacterium]
MGRTVRTNVVVDEDLVERVKERYGLKSKREAIDFALRAVAGEEEITDPWKGALELEGMWADRSEEELREIYGDKIPRR